MKITDLRVDGYGTLTDLQLGPLDGGLSVILGPNEAGKSTLLDFVRGILFGFPDRRHRSPYHEPLRGGRHGGALRLTDDKGAPWLLERHLDRRQPLLTGPDGQVADASVLRELLGSADDTLFRSVFAFGLGELANFETLDKDEVRELVFSAGVLGAGRSATQAIRTLEQRRGMLVRPRQQDALTNQLRRRLEELDQQLREARASTSAYATAKIECERLAEATREARQATEALRHRARDLERIESCWASWHRREESAALLRELGDLPDSAAAIAAAEVEVHALVSELSGHEERGRLAAKLDSQLNGIERELELRLAEIGFDPSTRVLPPLDIGIEEQVAELTRQHRECRAAERALDEERRAAQAEGASAREELYLEQHNGSARDLGALDAAARDTLQLRGLLGSLDRLEGDQLGRQHERELAAITLSHRRSGSAPLLAGLLALGALFVCIVLTTKGHGSSHLPTIMAGAALLISLATGLVLLLRHAPRARATSSREVVDNDSDAARAARVSTSIETLATGLGLPARPEPAELDAHAVRIESERQHRLRLDELIRAVDRTESRTAKLCGRLEALREAGAALEEDMRRIAEKLDLPVELSPEGLGHAIDAMRKAYALIAASARVAPELSSLNEARRDFELGLSGLLERLGIAPRDPDALSESVGALAQALEAALGGQERRKQLISEIATADRFLEESLGSGHEAEALRSEISSGAVLAWAEERRALDRALVDAEGDYEAHLARQHDAERSLLELLDSDEIASLQLEREALAAELEGALEQWLVLGLSSALLQRTLARYESERQPLVISRAASLFSKVTNGRYVTLVAREDADQRRHGIEVIGTDGQRVDAADLSRGTAEQLYLCLRLAFASTFAERAAALPLVLDDVLVNFDPERSFAMARAIAEVAQDHQVIVFTCHPHLIECFASASPHMAVLELERR